MRQTCLDASHTLIHAFELSPAIALNRFKVSAVTPAIESSHADAFVDGAIVATRICCLLGSSKSAAILATVSYAKWKRVIFARLDGILVVLLAASLLWGAGTLIFQAVFVSHLHVFMDPGSWSNKVSSLFLNVSFLLQFTTHLMLAMERLFIMRQIPEEASTVYFQRLLVAVSVPLLILIGISLAFRSLEGTPLDSFPIKLWTVAMTTVYTYATSNTLLKAAIDAKLKSILENGESDESAYKLNPFAMETMRLRVQRKILFTCIIMSSALMISYAVYMMFMVWYAWGYLDSGVERDPAMYALFQMTGSVLLALDTVVTPLLVVSFSRSLRYCLAFWRL